MSSPVYWRMVMPDRLYLADLFFKCAEPIRSLPEFHGARWHAWARFALKGYLDFDAAIFGLLPSRSGKHPILPGETLALRLVLTSVGAEAIDLIENRLTASDNGKAFGPAQLALDRDRTAVRPLNEAFLKDRLESLLALDTFSINLFTPLRLVAPTEWKGKDAKSRFCQPEFFASPCALDRMLAGVRRDPANRTACRIVSKDLVWKDLRYSRDRRVALGGVCGKIVCEGRPEEETARALILGQYAGCGKNPRFGLGYWRLCPD